MLVTMWRNQRPHTCWQERKVVISVTVPQQVNKFTI